MAVSFDKAVVLITGASSGIGREFARQLAGRASTLILVARRLSRLQQLESELTEQYPNLQVVVETCDLADLDATKQLVEKLRSEQPAIDVLINNAGFGDVGLFHRADWQKIETMLGVNMTGICLLCHWVLPGMVERRTGGILNISSGFGLTWMPFFAAYAGSKHFLTAFSECLRVELAGTGVVVSQVCPGPVRTEFEAVAASPFGFDLPLALQISAEKCARVSLRGFAKGKALIVPGLLAKLSIWSGRLSPRWVLRLVYGIGARVMRRRLPEKNNG